MLLCSPWIGEGGVAMLTIPPAGGHPHPVFLLQSDHGSGACPNGLYVLYAVSQAVGSAVEDLQVRSSAASTADCCAVGCDRTSYGRQCSPMGASSSAAVWFEIAVAGCVLFSSDSGPHRASGGESHNEFSS